eukprot:CAMPEP_0117450874 /NCGR_PEP_ID=MMETSP0759-20121206/8701_1 /TAXON_ID=63605 /ORGANISM="Percolomonas cosmopolitus, Strain WS" /LENGTH=400 /DNA_ID=CAMNT_0005243425 /DNA_START=94 /DNA_END=1296 /DNA_ORIENTATION=-
MPCTVNDANSTHSHQYRPSLEGPFLLLSSNPERFASNASTFSDSLPLKMHSSQEESKEKLGRTFTCDGPTAKTIFPVRFTQISIMNGKDKSPSERVPSTPSRKFKKSKFSLKKKSSAKAHKSSTTALSQRIIDSANRDKLVRLYQKYVNPENDGMIHKGVLKRHNLQDSTFRNVIGLRRNTVKVLDAIRKELRMVLEGGHHNLLSDSLFSREDEAQLSEEEEEEAAFSPETDLHFDPDFVLKTPKRKTRSSVKNKVEDEQEKDEVLQMLRSKDTPPSSPQFIESPVVDVSDLMKDVTEGPASLRTVWSTSTSPCIVVPSSSKRRLFGSSQERTIRKRKREELEEEPISKHVAAAFCDEYEIQGGDEHFIMNLDKKEKIQQFNRSPRHKRMRKCLNPERAV